jgi:hypothetical protein
MTHYVNKGFMNLKKTLLKPIFAVLITFYAMAATSHAKAFDETLWDLKVGLNARTYPIGAQAIGTGGWNGKLWGDSNTWKYGYVRAALNLATSAVVNRVGGEVQFFPISILGVSAGYDWGTRNITMKFLDCNQFECNGRMDRKFLKINAVGAYQGVIFSFMARYENLRAPVAHKPFFDEVTLLTGRSDGENTITLNPALLYTLNETWKVGFTSLYSRAIDTGGDGYTHLYGPIANWTEREWSIIGGVGLNRSPVVQSGYAAFFVLSYAFQPSLAISEMSMRFRN